MLGLVESDRSGHSGEFSAIDNPRLVEELSKHLGYDLGVMRGPVDVTEDETESLVASTVLFESVSIPVEEMQDQKVFLSEEDYEKFEEALLSNILSEIAEEINESELGLTHLYQLSIFAVVDEEDFRPRLKIKIRGRFKRADI